MFLVTYEKRRNEMGGGEPPHDDEVFVVTTKGAGQLPEYEKFMDPTPAFGMTAREGRRWTGRFKNWCVRLSRKGPRAQNETDSDD